MSLASCYGTHDEGEIMEILPQPLTKEAFAPYGDVIDIPSEAGRTYYEEALGNLRPEARPSLSLSLKAETPDRPLRAELLERHEFSSQTFVPIDVDRWLVVVAPHARTGGPDTKSVRAFIASGKQGVTYKPNTWHHGLTVLDKPGRFAVFMWRAGAKDEEFVPVEPFTIRIP
ncbi:MAG: ureidoglycolate lyase [Reyranellales bacterium]